MLLRSSLVLGAVFVCLSYSMANRAAAAEPQYVTLPDQYIITFRDGMTRQEVLSLTRQMTTEHRLRLRHTFKNTIKGFSATFPPGVADRLRNHPDVVAVEQNGYWYIEGSRTIIQTVDAPTNVIATPSDTQIDLTWTDNATTEQGTEIQRSTTGIGGTYTQLALVFGANTTSYTDTNVVADQEYCYQIRVGEGAGVLGPFSDAVCAIIQDDPATDPPAAPSGLTATTIDDQRIDLSYVDNADNETGFRIERATGSGGIFAEIDLTGMNVTTYSDTALDANTEYCYRVAAYNDIGDSDYTAEVCATTDAEPPATSPLGAPTNVVATAVTETQIDVTFTDNATEEVGFDLQRSSTGIDGTYSPLTVLSANSTSYSDTGVVSGTEYCYQIRAGRGAGDLGEFSARACATPGAADPTDPPAAPSDLTTTVVSFQRIDLSYVDNSDDEDGFEIERAEGAGGTFSQIEVTGAGITTYVDATLSAETEYCYRVRAFNSVGNSGYTAEVCATTPAEPPAGECADAGNHDDLTETWGITQIKADLNATWQATQTAGCELNPWFFGLDTGVDSDHDDLNVAEIMGHLAADPAHSGEDGHGHGTHTAGTAAAIDGNDGVVGVAPGASVYGFKVCDDAGSCAIDDIVSGVDEVTARKNANPDQPMVINMSLGGGANESNDTAVRRAANAGITIALSAGNGALNACLFPVDSQNNSPARTGDDLINAQDGSDGDTARVNGIITVTSSDSTDSDVNCNFGNPVTVAAPGDDIWSTWLDNGHAFSSGTSMASPHVAGAAILYLHSNPDAAPADVEQAIVNELDPWTTDESPNADGRLDAETL